MKKRLISSKQRDTISDLKTSFLAGKTPAQVDNYVDTKVTDLPSAKELLKKMIKAIIILAKHQNLQ